MRLTGICLDNIKNAASMAAERAKQVHGREFDIKDIVKMLMKYNSLPRSTSIKISRSYDNFYWKSAYSTFKRRKLSEEQYCNAALLDKLGTDLYTSYFVVDRGGRVRLTSSTDKWISKIKQLPEEYVDSVNLLGIDASNCGILPNGIDNFHDLNHLRYLNLSKNEDLDDLACDQLSRQFRFSKTLEFIDISHNHSISINGIEILLRIPSVKIIKCKDTEASKYKHLKLFSVLAEDECGCKILAKVE